MQQQTIDEYKTAMTTLINTAPTVANLATIKTLSADLYTARDYALSTQNPTEQQNYVITMLQSNVLNSLLKNGKLIMCYYDYDNEISTEPNALVKNALIEAKQLMKEEIKTAMDADPFFKLIKHISIFVNS